MLTVNGPLEQLAQIHSSFPKVSALSASRGTHSVDWLCWCDDPLLWRSWCVIDEWRAAKYFMLLRSAPFSISTYSYFLFFNLYALSFKSYQFLSSWENTNSFGRQWTQQGLKSGKEEQPPPVFPRVKLTLHTSLCHAWQKNQQCFLPLDWSTGSESIWC